MSIIVYCKQCLKKIRVPDAAAGKQGNCPRCKERVVIPLENEDGPPAPIGSVEVGQDAGAVSPETDGGLDSEQRLDASKGIDDVPEVEAQEADEATSTPPRFWVTPKASGKPVSGEPAEKKLAGRGGVQAGKIVVNYDEPVMVVKQGKAGPGFGDRAATSPSPAVGVWHVSPDPRPSLMPFLLVLLSTGLVLVASYGLWLFLTADSSGADEGGVGDVQPFKVPFQEDDWQRLKKTFPKREK